MAGCPASFDVILYPVQQSMQMSHKFDHEKIKDADGNDSSQRAQNEMLDGSLEMKLLGDTLAHAQSGAAFFAPLASVTISACPVSIWNGVWFIAPDSNLSLKNDAVGDVSYKLQRYVDATQNTLMTSTPT